MWKGRVNKMLFCLSQALPELLGIQCLYLDPSPVSIFIKLECVFVEYRLTVYLLSLRVYYPELICD